MRLTCTTPRPDLRIVCRTLLPAPLDSRQQTLHSIILSQNRASVQNCTNICSQLLISEHKPVQRNPVQVRSLFAG